MKPVIHLIAGLGTAAFAASLSGQGFNDVFDVDTSDINSIGYFQSGNLGGGSGTAVMDGSLVISYGSGSIGLANIARHFPTVEIGVGESIQANFTLSAGGLNQFQRMIRFSLGYVAPENQLTANSPLRSPIEPDGFWGYVGAIAGPGAGVNSSIGIILNTGNVVHKEGNPDNGNDAGALNWIEDLSASVDSTFTGLEGELFLLRTTTGWDITASLGDVLITTSHEGVLTQFNTFGFGLNGGQDNAFYSFDNISVTVIPEPSTYAVVLGLAALVGLLGVRRRQRRG